MDTLLETAVIVNDRYRIVRQLGQGGFSRTYLAEDTHRFDERCVIKEFAPQNQSPEIRQKAEELFEREAKVLYKLEHSQIPRFRAVFRLQERLFLVQDYIEGQTYRERLNQRLGEGKSFTEAEIIELLEQTLPILDYLHSQGIIHRDIAPDNLIYRYSDQLPVLIDFGSVKQIDPNTNGSLTAPIVTQLGKMGYAPQEQIEEGIVYPHSDLYALAVTALVLLTAKEPSSLQDKETQQWQWPQETVISPKLKQILTKMLAKEPLERFQTAKDVLTSLKQAHTQLLEAQPTIIVAPSPPPALPSSNTQEKETMALTSSSKPSPIIGCLSKILLVLTIILGSGLLGWVAGKAWLKQAMQTDTKTPEQVFTPSSQDNANSTPDHSTVNREWQRQEALRNRRQQLGIDHQFFQNLVEQSFFSQYPDQTEKSLGEAQWREKRDRIANELLDKLTFLSDRARQGLGSYNLQQLGEWKQQVNQLHLSSRALYDLANASFLHLFPDEREQQFSEQPIGQIWSANVLNSLEALQTGQAYEEITSIEETGTQRQGTLEPGKGKAYVVQLQEGQQLNLQLEAAGDVLLSAYSPTGSNNLLEDSTQTQWSGTLSESGYYEITIVSKSEQNLTYELNLQISQPHF